MTKQGLVIGWLCLLLYVLAMMATYTVHREVIAKAQESQKELSDKTAEIDELRTQVRALEAFCKSLDVIKWDNDPEQFQPFRPDGWGGNTRDFKKGQP